MENPTDDFGFLLNYLAFASDGLTTGVELLDDAIAIGLAARVLVDCFRGLEECSPNGWNALS